MENSLSEKYYPIVKRIAWQVKRRVPSAEIDDMINEGYIGFMLAESHYDPRNGGLFYTYATKVIRCCIFRYLQTQNMVARHTALYRLRKIRNKLGKMRAINGHDAPLEKILGDAGMTYEQYQNYRRHCNATRVIFFDDYFKGNRNSHFKGNNRNPIDYLARENHTPLEDCIASEQKKIVLEAIDSLPQGRQGSVERTKKVICLYWFEGLTLEEIGESYGITRERARQILDKGMIKLEDILSAKLQRQINEGKPLRRCSVHNNQHNWRRKACKRGA